MSLINVAPQRLALMAQDASTEIVYVTDTFQETLDSMLRPAVIIETGEGEFTGGAAGIRDASETYTMSLIGNKRGTGGDGSQEERRTREIAHDIEMYFLKHTQLQMSNQRGKVPAALPPLATVEWLTLRRVSGLNPSAKGAEEDFWGVSWTVIIQEFVLALERLVSR